MGKIVGLAVLAVVGLSLIIGVLFVLGYFGFTNDANHYETDIAATYQNNKNIYDNGWKQVKETAQVPDMYIADMQKVWQSALTGRYGEKGSQAVMQFIKESNPNVDSKLYAKVQQTIESFRNDFASNQTKLISQKQAYGVFLYSNTSSRFYSTIAQYPKKKMGVPDGSPDDYAILTSGKTEDDFKSKKADELKLR